MKQVSDENIAERIALLEHAEAETGQLSLHGETELAWLREFRDLREKVSFKENLTAQIVELQQKLDALTAEVFEEWDFQQVKEFCYRLDVTVCARTPYAVSKAVREYRKNAINKLAKHKVSGTGAYLNSVRAEVIKSVPTVCDGKEQVAFEDYARSKGLDLNQHPLHYLFLDDKTNTARNAWRECLNYVVAQVRSGTHDTADKAG